jgi:CDP-glycerol glycerophosphotransferase (TagB/SpsB family)
LTAARRIRVVFLTFYFEAWDALADVHALMAADSRFEVTVATIARRFTGDSGFAEEDEVSAYFDGVGIEHLRLNESDSYAGLARLKALEPDYVFINYPWQRNYPPAFRVDELVKFTRVCYVPYYSLPIVNEPGETGVAPHIYQQRSHQLASLVFTQDPAAREAYAHTSRGNAHVHLTGTPKIDALVRQANSGITRWPLPPSKNLRMVWAPHHSYSDAWLNFGLFAKIHQAMLAFARTTPHLEIVMRPHPFLFGTMVDRGLISDASMKTWLDEWNALPNTAIDADGDAAHLFNATDLFVTDGISFLGEYPLATNKPTIFMEKPGHWEFSPLGVLVAAANIRINSFEQFEMVFDEIRAHGLPEYYAEIGRLRDAASPHPGEAAAKIIEVVVEDFAAETPLVNPSVVTEIAWENRPGAEPAWD